MNIYTHPTEIKAISQRLNRRNYIGTKSNTDYHFLDGKFYSVWQSGCGNYPELVTDVSPLIIAFKNTQTNKK